MMTEDAVPHKRARLSPTDVSDNLNLHGYEESSNNSLIRLDNKCMLEIFVRMDLEDLCRLTEVSKKFKEVAEQAFKLQYVEIDFELIQSSTTSDFRRVLCKFGRLVKSIDISDHEDETLLYSITRYCSGTLEKLIVCMTKIDCNKVIPLFSHLKFLLLNDCAFRGDRRLLFSHCSRLETLYFDEITDSSFIEQTFPKLTTLEIGEIKRTSLWRVLELNPQIKDLRLWVFPDDDVIRNIVNLSKNVEKLMIKPGIMNDTVGLQREQAFLQLSKLNLLKDLELDAGAETYSRLARRLMNALSKAKVPLQYLDLENFSITAKEIKSITAINTLKTVRLKPIEVNSIDHLIPLVQQLPLLRGLQFVFKEVAKISFDDIRNFIQLAKKMECLGVFNIRKLKIKRHDYDSILEIVRQEHRKRLVIHLETSDD